MKNRVPAQERDVFPNLVALVGMRQKHVLPLNGRKKSRNHKFLANSNTRATRSQLSR